ncbi:MAG: AMP-binding protein, partial [Desulforhopalus sp.]
MPRDEIVREITLGQILAETVAKYPDETAVAYVEREYNQTWKEFSDTVDTMAKGLMAMGIKKGEKVAVWATNV